MKKINKIRAAISERITMLESDANRYTYKGSENLDVASRLNFIAKGLRQAISIINKSGDAGKEDNADNN